MTARPLPSYLLFLFVGTILTAKAADWPYYQHDPEHTGRSTAVVDAAKLMHSWTAPDGYATPQIVGDTVYSNKTQGGFSGTRDDGTQWATYISAFDLHTGAIKWTHSGNYIHSSPVAVGGGLVVFHGGATSVGSSPPTPDAEQLLVLDATTGAVRYKVADVIDRSSGSGGPPMMMPLLVPNPDGTMMAYVADGARVWAVRLGSTSGSIVWRQSGQFGGRSMPTLVGNSIVLAGPCHFYAFDQATGTPNHFHQGTCQGGGGTTAAYDSVRQNVYILEFANSPGGGLSNQALTAYRYKNNAQIDFLWQRVGEGIGYGSVAIGPSGSVYVADFSHLLELDPNTGATLRSSAGSFTTVLAPAITEGLIWMETSGGTTTAYDLETMQAMRTLLEQNSSSRYPAPGAFADGYFVMARGDNVFSEGFDVWANPAAQAMNISTRLRVRGGENVMIGGFIITGTEPKRVLIRALGPALQQFGISDALPNPMIELSGSAGPIASNNNWKDTQEAEIQDTGLAPPNNLEAAMVVTLDPGNYTAVVRDADGDTGVGLVEVYDLAAAAQAKLANISTRGFVESGVNVMIGGFILGNGAVPARVLIRAIGPSLAQHGVSDPLQDPILELFDANGTLMRSNDNWRDPQQAEIEATGLAPQSNAESAIIATLTPAPYTAIVAGKNGLTGVGLVEVYQLP